MPVVLIGGELNRDDLTNYLGGETAKNHSYPEVEGRRARCKYGNQAPAVSQILDILRVAQRSTPTRMPNIDIGELPSVDPIQEGVEPTP